jgi:hypothetical protein
MDFPQPQAEHRWLLKLVGEWTTESECSPGPGEPPIKTTGTETVRSLGDLWTIGEGSGAMPGGGVSKSVMTLGYDPAKKKFVGSFIASVMTHFWPYEGELESSGKALALMSEGPSFSGSGMAKYKDVIEFHSDDHRTLSAWVLDEKGNWNKFMEMHYRRKK